MPRAMGNYSYFLVFVDTFTGCVEAFPCQTEKASKVTKALLKEIVSHFGLSLSIQSDNREAFITKATQGVSGALECSGSYVLHGDPSLWGRLKR